jgi:two-component system sensor histidine kinase KdpD
MSDRRRGRRYAGVVLILALCTLLAALMQKHFDSAGLTMVYLLGVVVAAVAFGRGPAVLASVLSVAIFDYAFVPPRYTFEVADAQYLVVFAVMLAVAVITGTLTARLREQREESRRRERRTEALYRLTHDLAARSTTSEVLQAAVDRVSELFGSRAAALVPDERGILSVAAGDSEAVAPAPDRAAAEWAFANGQPSGALTGIPPGARTIHTPLIAGAKILGVLSLEATAQDADPETPELVRALSSQTAIALERCRLAEDATRIRGQIEVERARSALLSSVSHDLRTPLAAIAGAASGLRSGEGLPVATRAELAQTISDEAERLDRLIGNLLDMTRVESGTLRVKKEWHSIEDVVGAALTRLEQQLGGRRVQLALPADLPLVPVDDVLLEAVVRNLIENAHKYSGADASIDVAARIEGDWLRLDVADRGMGLREGEEQRVFEKFYRGEPGRALPGVGLGLAICKGVVEAHRGTIEASNRTGGGAVFTIRLPLEGAPPRVEPEGAGAGGGA